MGGKMRTPDNVIKLTGNTGKRKRPTGAPKPIGKAVCPKWMSNYAKEEWARVYPELDRLGLLTLVDETSFAAYCQAYSRWRKAEESVEDDGPTLVTTNGNVIHNPAAGAANQAMTLMHRYLVEFGMTPLARTKLINSAVEDKQDDFDKMQNKIKAGKQG